MLTISQVNNLYLRHKKLFMFLLVGVVNTLFGYSMFALFITLGFDYPIACLLATILGILFNFKTLGNLVFEKNNNYLLLKFISVYCLLYFINIVLIKLLYPFLNNLYLCGFCATFITAIVSYNLNKNFVFEGIK